MPEVVKRSNKCENEEWCYTIHVLYSVAPSLPSLNWKLLKLLLVVEYFKIKWYNSGVCVKFNKKVD